MAEVFSSPDGAPDPLIPKDPVGRFLLAWSQLSALGGVALMLGIALFAAMFVFAGNTLADIFARWLDPRLDRLEVHHHGH